MRKSNDAGPLGMCVHCQQPDASQKWACEIDMHSIPHGLSGIGQGDKLAAGAGAVTAQTLHALQYFNARLGVWPPDIQPGHRLHANDSAMRLV